MALPPPENLLGVDIDLVPRKLTALGKGQVVVELSNHALHVAKPSQGNTVFTMCVIITRIVSHKSSCEKDESRAGPWKGHTASLQNADVDRKASFLLGMLKNEWIAGERFL
jgi:hypothetical protein